LTSHSSLLIAITLGVETTHAKEIFSKPAFSDMKSSV